MTSKTYPVFVHGTENGWVYDKDGKLLRMRPENMKSFAILNKPERHTRWYWRFDKLYRNTPSIDLFYDNSNGFDADEYWNYGAAPAYHHY